MRRIPSILLLALAALATPATASAGSGAATYEDAPATEVVPAAEGPVLTAFTVSSRRLYLYGRAARVRFQISSETAATVEVSLALARAGDSSAPRTIELGERPTGLPQTYRLTGREGRPLREGRYTVRILARDSAGRPLRPAARASDSTQLSLYGHRFPLGGAFTYSGAEGRFGAPRPGRSHQGQDLIAAEGVPVVAPRGGRVKTVAYQAEGAGHYVIIDGAGESLDYAFLHLQAGSVRVREGQYVRTGARVASVGNSGRSFGAHLHLEMWRGPWFGGGEPIDPLPFLRRWDSWS